jgi:hypothetical protein
VGREGGQFVDMLTGMAEVSDLGGGREQLIGDVPIHAAPSPSTTSWRMCSDPRRRASASTSWPNTLEERLELLALGEVIAPHCRHRAQVHHALEAGAAWAQIAAARGTDEATAPGPVPGASRRHP